MASTTPSSQALTRRSTDQSLMPPPPPPKRIKRPTTVLDEDVYTNALSQIIARDYFPGLLETQIKQEYLDALESKDKEWIASSRKKLAGLMTPGRTERQRMNDMRSRVSIGGSGGRPDETPAGWGGDTPMSVVSTSSTTTSATTTQAESKHIPDVSGLGLEAFQAKYTSEDNESFNKVLDKQNAKHREKFAWLWSGNKIPSARQIAHQQQEIKRITERGEKPKEEQLQLLLKTDLDARPAKPDSWKVRPENSLMFLPSSIEDTHETIAQKADAVSRAGPKRVMYQNTRLPDPALQAPQAPPPSPSISAIQDAIAGRPRHTESEAGYTGGETPRVNGYAFVDEDEPEPEPSFAGRDGDNEVDLHLLRSATGDATPNPFEIKQNRKREDLHHRMVDRVSRTKRAEKFAREARSSVVPRFASSPQLDFGLRTPGSVVSGSGGGGSTSGQGKMLTPAAQKLLRQVGSTPRTGVSSSNLKNMWTPTPKRK